jgi:PAS domain S-box-containing protein
MDDASILRAIFEATPECIKIVARDGIVLQMNAAGRAMLEAAENTQVEGCSVYDVIAPEFVQDWKEKHQRVCLGEKLSWEFDIIGLAGTRRHMETHAVPLALPDGVAQLAISRDVTRRKEDERKMRESEHRYKEMLQALPLPVYTTDLDGRINFFNEAAVEFAGRRPEAGEKWCVTWRLFYPDGTPMPHDQCSMAIALKEGRAVRGMEGIAERPDGTRVRFASYPTPLLDTSGNATGAINVLVDLTERYRISEMSARLASIVESSDDAIVSKDLNGTIISWNAGASRVFGYEASEMVGQPIIRIIPPELHDEERQILERLSRGERIDHFETVRVAKNGSRLDISLSVSPVRDPRGIVVGASKVARDITERKRAEKLQQLLIDELNHRVKNTLAMIQAISSQSLRHAKNSRDFVSSFNGRVQALALAHESITATKMEGADVIDIVREQVALGQGEDRRIRCSGPTLLLDPQVTVHLSLVLHELATNARKYGALSVPEGRLTVRWEVRSTERQSLFLVWEESNGPKVSAPRERGFGSTLIERTLSGHGGESSIRYNEAGVTCHITLPLADQAQSNGISPADGDSGSQIPDRGRSLKGKRVIIVEDEPLLSMELESLLTAHGCEIAGTAGTLEKAKALVERTDCDVALLDLTLGGQPVIEVAAKLTQRNVPFAFVSGYGREVLPEGFKDAILLTKPVNLGNLIAAIQQLTYKAPGVIQLRRSDPSGRTQR